MTSAWIYCACVSATHGDDWWCWWVLIQRTRGCWSRARHQTAPRSRGKSPWVVCSRPPAPGKHGQKKTHRSRLFSKTMRHHRRRGMEARVGASLRKKSYHTLRRPRMARPDTYQRLAARLHAQRSGGNSLRKPWRWRLLPVLVLLYKEQDGNPRVQLRNIRLTTGRQPSLEATRAWGETGGRLSSVKLLPKTYFPLWKAFTATLCSLNVQCAIQFCMLPLLQHPC